MAKPMMDRRSGQYEPLDLMVARFNVFFTTQTRNSIPSPARGELDPPRIALGSFRDYAATHGRTECPRALKPSVGKARQSRPHPAVSWSPRRRPRPASSMARREVLSATVAKAPLRGGVLLFEPPDDAGRAGARCARACLGTKGRKPKPRFFAGKALWR